MPVCVQVSRWGGGRGEGGEHLCVWAVGDNWDCRRYFLQGQIARGEGERERGEGRGGEREKEREGGGEEGEKDRVKVSYERINHI